MRGIKIKGQAYYNNDKLSELYNDKKRLLISEVDRDSIVGRPIKLTHIKDRIIGEITDAKITNDSIYITGDIPAPDSRYVTAEGYNCLSIGYTNIIETATCDIIGRVVDEVSICRDPKIAGCTLEILNTYSNEKNNFQKIKVNLPMENITAPTQTPVDNKSQPDTKVQPSNDIKQSQPESKQPPVVKQDPIGTKTEPPTTSSDQFDFPAEIKDSFKDMSHDELIGFMVNFENRARTKEKEAMTLKQEVDGYKKKYDDVVTTSKLAKFTDTMNNTGIKFSKESLTAVSSNSELENAFTQLGTEKLKLSRELEELKAKVQDFTSSKQETKRPRDEERINQAKKNVSSFFEKSNISFPTDKGTRTEQEVFSKDTHESPNMKLYRENLEKYNSEPNPLEKMIEMRQQTILKRDYERQFK